jgi:superfamily II DNA or RNA helicase
VTTVWLPEQWELVCDVAGNTVRQLRRESLTADANVYTLAITKKQTGFRVELEGRSVAVVGKQYPELPAGEVLLWGSKGKAVLPTEDGETPWRWLRPLPATSCTIEELRARAEQVRDSWQKRFDLRMETEETSGLREPQVGALYALLAHWTMSDDAATVVMPTGSGKTETMLSAIVSERLTNVLVVVPSVALREQTVDKFAHIGVLPALGVVREGVGLPLIGTLEHGIEDASEAEAFILSSNVTVATMGAINACSAEARLAIANATKYLFIDEAHHIPAATWAAFRMHFPTSRVVQFTATPFRNDGKRVDGRVVYDYPLGRAQANGMFQEIRFTAVAAFSTDDADLQIAKQTKTQLAADLAAGLDHLVMARARSINRAESLLELYRVVAPEYGPVLIHSEMTTKQRRAALQALRSRTSRIIVCVNMLGEGFALPQL